MLTKVYGSPHADMGIVPERGDVGTLRHERDRWWAPQVPTRVRDTASRRSAFPYAYPRSPGLRIEQQPAGRFDVSG